MPVPDLTLLARDNPWWGDHRAIDRDPQIRAVEAAPFVWRPPLPFASPAPAVYTLRGPRQVGKTTLLKLFIRDLIEADRRTPRSILYLDCERAGLSGAHELAHAVRVYLHWAAESQPLYICLDEVTRVRDWGSAVRRLADSGVLESSVLIATGSHALDVKRGGERMPGRRGRARHFDYLLMPLSFRDYVSLRLPDIGTRLPALDSLEESAETLQAAREAALDGAVLELEFERYLATGGFLAAVTRERQEGEIGTDLYVQHRDAIVGEVIRTGHRESYFRELVRWLWPRLGREFSWRDAAGETEIGTHVTARRYLEDMEELYVWHIFQRVKEPDRPSPAFKSPKKLYPLDPFTFHTLNAWGRGALDPWRCTCEVLADPGTASRVVEGVVADHLRRAYGRNCFYYRSRTGREVDFVAFGPGDGRTAMVEVKWRDRVERRDWQPLAEQGGGLLLTRSTLAELVADPPTLAIPVHLFAATLAAAPTLRPLRYAD
jgi:predicted AAA+ superfamily ATPase